MSIRNLPADVVEYSFSPYSSLEELYNIVDEDMFLRILSSRINEDEWLMFVINHPEFEEIFIRDLRKYIGDTYSDEGVRKIRLTLDLVGSNPKLLRRVIEIYSGGDDFISDFLNMDPEIIRTLDLSDDYFFSLIISYVEGNIFLVYQDDISEWQEIYDRIRRLNLDIDIDWDYNLESILTNSMYEEQNQVQKLLLNPQKRQKIREIMDFLDRNGISIEREV